MQSSILHDLIWDKNKQELFLARDRVGIRPLFYTTVGDSFVFALKNMPQIRLVLKEKQEFDKIVLGAASSKLNFSLTANISEISESTCETQLLFEGDFNPMMAMMVKSPLQKFINTLTENASKLS